MPRSVWLFVVALLIPAFQPSGLAAESDRPNIVLIMADDLGLECLQCYGGMSYQTPRLDQLAAEGLRFTHAYSQPLCTPTRVQLMTGRYNHRNWISFGILDPSAKTFGHLLRDAGYRTCITGKWQLQSYDPPDFPNAARRRGIGMKVTEAGFEEHCLFHSWHTEDKGSRYANPTYFRNGKLEHADGQYGPDISVDFALDFMQRHRDEPMFVYYPMALPHWPMVPTPDSEEWADPARRLDEGTEYFADMVAYMDKVVGRFVDGIDKLGLKDNTLVLFYGDNGTDRRITSKLGDQDVEGGKATPAQTGIRVPLIARWPVAIKGGRTTSDLIDASDFLPTLAELAGTQIPADWQHDGISFASQLKGQWDKERYSRHIFALDHNYKLFSDGRFFDIRGEGVREVALDSGKLSDEAKAARTKLQRVIDRTMRPPISPAAKVVVDAFGDPVESKN
jgi:arylsulfatase A